MARASQVRAGRRRSKGAAVRSPGKILFVRESPQRKEKKHKNRGMRHVRDREVERRSRNSKRGGISGARRLMELVVKRVRLSAVARVREEGLEEKVAKKQRSDSKGSKGGEHHR